MSSIKNEQNLLQSDNGQIILTTHRLIQRSGSSVKEIMLSDLISYEVVKLKSRYYKNLSIVFGVLTGIFGIWFISKEQSNRRFGAQLSDALELNRISNDQQLQSIKAILIFVAFILFCSLVLYFRSGKKTLSVTGKYNSLEFSVDDLSSRSMEKFQNTLLSESEKRKRE